ncbi:sulfotransferase family [Fragilaria crotonensis]|nr:sulfotransferase family [Fragilaria crotonensis]
MIGVSTTSSGNARMRRPAQAQAIYNAFIIVVTATITWNLAFFVNTAFLKNSSTIPVISRAKPPCPRQTLARMKASIIEKDTLKLPKGHIDYSDYTGPSREFTKFEHAFPCFRGEKKLMLMTPAKEGILFQRPTKTGSTTMTGIVLRLVHNRGQKVGFEKCKHRSIHGSGRLFKFGQRNKTRSFLFSIIRHPQARALSQIFHFEVTVGRHEPTDEFVMQKLLQNYNHMHYLNDLRVRDYASPHEASRKHQLAVRMGYDSVQSQANALEKSSPEVVRHYERVWKQWREFGPNVTQHKVIGDILDDYDFIAIMERMDESLVVLQMLLNLTTKEILYTRARSGGSFSNGFKDRPCIYILPGFTSPGMKEFLASDEWKEHVAADMDFLKAAHKSLDRTIEALGREEFNHKLSIFRNALKLAALNCAGRVRTMCSAGGEVIRPVNTTCYVWGEGCDHDCIDELEL